MQKTLKLYLENFTGFHHQMVADLAKIAQDPDSKAYPDMAKGHRLKRVVDAQRAGKAMHGDFLNSTWPAVQQLRQKEAEAILSKLKGGPRSARTGLSDEEWSALGITSREAKTVYLQGDRLQAQLEDMARVNTRQLALATHAMRTTSDIEALIDSYRQAARGDLAGFDHAAWQADRSVLPLILAQRTKDNRAGMLVQSNFVAEIEQAVVQQTVEPDHESQFLLQRIGDMLDAMVATDGGRPVENLGPIAEFCGQVERRLSRDQQSGPDTHPTSV